jgi:hypothetical protein
MNTKPFIGYTFPKLDIKQNWNASIGIQILYNSHTTFITYYATATIGTAAAAGR